MTALDPSVGLRGDGLLTAAVSHFTSGSAHAVPGCVCECVSVSVTTNDRIKQRARAFNLGRKGSTITGEEELNLTFNG